MHKSQFQIKICGFTNKENALGAACLGIDALGFVFYPKSRRYVEPEKVKPIIEALPPFLKKVGVVVNPSLEEAEEIIFKSGVDCIQLHGQESSEFCQTLTKKNIHWIKAFQVKKDFRLAILKTYPTKLFLLDTWDPLHYGGTGKSWDWNLVKNLNRDYNFIISGGINAQNIVQVHQESESYYFDVSSGVEEDYGIKSLHKIREIMQALKKMETTAFSKKN